MEQFNKDISKIQTDQNTNPQSKNIMTTEQKKLAALSLPRKKKKLYDKLQRVKKSKLQAENKLQQKRKLLSLKRKEIQS
ncbi:hypothetical protein HZS_8134 [Henneguya salminicola]|nr:hypothetical protein HZS_8134 [Henneguya salminicola]